MQVLHLHGLLISVLDCTIPSESILLIRHLCWMSLVYFWNYELDCPGLYGFTTELAVHGHFVLVVWCIFCLILSFELTVLSCIF